MSSSPHHNPRSTGGRGTGKVVIPSSQETNRDKEKVSQGWTPIALPHAQNPTWHPSIEMQPCPASLQSFASAVLKMMLRTVNPEPRLTDSLLTRMLRLSRLCPAISEDHSAPPSPDKGWSDSHPLPPCSALPTGVSVSRLPAHWRDNETPNFTVSAAHR